MNAMARRRKYRDLEAEAAVGPTPETVRHQADWPDLIAAWARSEQITAAQADAAEEIRAIVTTVLSAALGAGRLDGAGGAGGVPRAWIERIPESVRRRWRAIYLPWAAALGRDFAVVYGVVIEHLPTGSERADVIVADALADYARRAGFTSRSRSKRR